jgi:hypothetical protein
MGRGIPYRANRNRPTKGATRSSYAQREQAGSPWKNATGACRLAPACRRFSLQDRCGTVHLYLRYWRRQARTGSGQGYRPAAKPFRWTANGSQKLYDLLQ